ncbi:MAG: 1-deoxy-D-xylulose-5-phosphate synthase [Firmicutes bacterium]|nr:1-deoxy-D-xylulose-5-phosphate synthase [Bacillota bacterium]
MKKDNIFDYKKIKEMQVTEMQELAIDIRKFILENVSSTGGHLSSNLGIVDLTIAMMKIFDPEKDIFLYDVGHQCYPYKILTGRSEAFTSLRKKDGLSGFQSISESKYDRFEAGHSSTSIGTGLGMAIARDLDKNNYNIISIIGDGSISNGLAYEALNQIGDMQAKQIIILNDNQMSISENVGAIHNVLDSIRSGKGYNKAKKNTKNILNKTKIGKNIAKGLNSVKENLKKIYLNKGSLFDDFGIEYYGPINGHDYEELLKYLEIAKNENGPVLLHVITQKGMGYPLAEEDKIGKFHGISAFDTNTGELKKVANLPSYSEIISSYVYNFARKDKDIICITPGMCYGSKLDTIKEKLPNQFIDVGIAEEHGLLLANGLALNNKKPIFFVYSTFLQRGYDELVHDIARMKTGVTLCIDRAGLVPGDGVSHQGVFDIPMMMNIPNMIITMPKDAKEANDLICTSLACNAPFAIRYPKINIKYDYGKAQVLPIGSWDVARKGQDAFIITYGDFVGRAINIAEQLAKENLDISVINARFIKPYDKKMFSQIVKMNKPIYIYEESMKLGSLGSVLAQDVLEYNFSSKFKIFAINDEFLTHASREELIKLTALDEQTIINKIKEDFK